MDPRKQSTSNKGPFRRGITGAPYLPPKLQDEALKKFLKELDPEHITWEKLELFNTWWVSLLRYGEVCNLWKEQCDKGLEDAILSMIRRWQPNKQWDDIFPPSIAEVVISPSENVANYPSFVSSYDGRNPFPGRVLSGRGNFPDNPHIETPRFANDLIIRFASHISVLCLTYLNLELQVFTSILGATKNLKALVLNNMHVLINGRTELSKYPMPKLAKLDNLLLMDLVYLFNTEVKGFDQDVISNPLRDVWLFKDHNDQLVNMEMTCWRSINIGSLPNIEQLSLITSDLSWLQPICPGVSLKKLGVSMRRSVFEHIVWDVANLFEYLDPYADQLDEVYLDISWDNFICREPNKENESLSPLVKRFPFVRKVTFGDPQSRKHDKMLVYQILLRFPSVEELVLLSAEATYHPSPIYYPNSKKVAEARPRFLKYWHNCPNLKEISCVTRLKAPHFDVQCTYKRP